MRQLTWRVKGWFLLRYHRRAINQMTPMQRPLIAASLALMEVIRTTPAEVWERRGSAGRRVVQRVSAFGDQAAQVDGSARERAKMYRRLVDLVDAIDAASDDPRDAKQLAAARRYLADFREQAEHMEAESA